MGIGHRQSCVHKQPDCRAGVQLKVADRQLIGTVHFDILNAKFALKQVSSQCSIGHRKTEILPVLCFQLLQAFFLQQYAVVNDSDVIGQQGNLRQDMTGDQNGFPCGIAQFPNEITYFCDADINLLLIVFLILRNTRKVERAMTPILQGIQNLSHGKASHLEEQGELAEINAGLNRAADYMKKKDNTRAEWIRGVSHDIRTPLSMVLGYASELEDDRNLPPNARKQAGIIRRESEKMKRLIDDLNLTTKLEYALQPVHFKDVDWVETSRQAVSEVLNSGLDSRYEIVFAEMQPGRTIHLLGDEGLLRRMLDNLLRNSITHNPQGCRIAVSVGEENGRCICTVSDDGMGITPERLKALNRGDDIASTQGSDEKSEHGLGLKLVAQIVKSHRGIVAFSANAPHGLEVRISLPTQPLIS